MTTINVQNSLFDINVDALRDFFGAAMECCLTSSEDKTSGSDVSPEALNSSMQQFFDVIDTINRQSTTEQSENPLETDDLADYGLALLSELAVCALELECEESYAIFAQLSIPIAIWAAQHGLTIHDIELLVNAISTTANQTHDQAYLAELIDAIDVIIKSISPDIKADLDKANSRRPWRILNLNQGIIATRSLDPKKMEDVFEQLIYRLPEDAPGFFAQGMEQMDIIGYPDHVREVMQKYYHLTNKPTLH